MKFLLLKSSIHVDSSCTFIYLISSGTSRECGLRRHECQSLAAESRFTRILYVFHRFCIMGQSRSLLVKSGPTHVEAICIYASLICSSNQLNIYIYGVSTSNAVNAYAHGAVTRESYVCVYVCVSLCMDTQKLYACIERTSLLLEPFRKLLSSPCIDHAQCELLRYEYGVHQQNLDSSICFKSCAYGLVKVLLVSHTNLAAAHFCF